MAEPIGCTFASGNINSLLMKKDSVVEDFQRIIKSYIYSSSSGLSVNSFYIILYVLYAHHHGLKREQIFGAGCIVNYSIPSELDEQPKYILSCIWRKAEFDWSKRKNPTFVVSLCGELWDFIQDNEDDLEGVYGDLVETLVSQMLYMGHEVGEFLSVPEVVNLVASIAATMSPQAVYDPFAGICSFAVASQLKDVQFTGQDINRDLEVLSMVRLEAARRSNFNFWQFDSFHTLKDIENHDTLVSEPPLGVRLDSDFRAMCPSLRTEEYLIRVFIDTETIQKAVFVFPTSFCYSRNLSNIRKELCDKNYISSVISLPENLLQFTGVQVCIIVLEKGRETDTIRFVDTKDLRHRKGRRDILDWERVLSVYCNGSSLTSECRDVHCSETEPELCYLMPKFYTLDDQITAPNDYKVVSLGELLVANRPILTDKKEGRVISGSDFQSNRIGKTIKASSLELKSFGEEQYFEIVDSCIVFPAQRPELACYLVKEDDEVFTKSRILSCYTVTNQDVDPYYLIGELSKDYFKKQLDRFYSGFYAHQANAINLRYFLSCKVVLPSKEVQHEQFLKEQMEALRSEGIMVDAIAKEKVDLIMKNQRQKKHAVQQIMNDILPALDDLLGYISENESINKDTIVSVKSVQTLGDVIRNITNEANRVSRMVDKFTMLETYGPSEEILVSATLKEYCNTRIDDTYEVHFYGLEDEYDVRVMMWGPSFLQMFDNLFSNAKKYGFKESLEKRYVIRVYLSMTELPSRIPAVKISVVNNGEPVSKSISLDKLFVWGFGQGDGIGCNQVKEIVEHYGGEVAYCEYPDDPEDYCSEFNIVLPIVNE